mmetsp:Transcript_26378/g.69345  ORF Transcript_26378/g.69345 Transcript_26378/m.69345 type:complete len:279 (+) Transcript_26378:343-1179(+)
MTESEEVHDEVSNVLRRVTKPIDHVFCPVLDGIHNIWSRLLHPVSDIFGAVRHGLTNRFRHVSSGQVISQDDSAHRRSGNDADARGCNSHLGASAHTLLLSLHALHALSLLGDGDSHLLSWPRRGWHRNLDLAPWGVRVVDLNDGTCSAGRHSDADHWARRQQGRPRCTHAHGRSDIATLPCLHVQLQHVLEVILVGRAPEGVANVLLSHEERPLQQHILLVIVVAPLALELNLKTGIFVDLAHWASTATTTPTATTHVEPLATKRFGSRHLDQRGCT